jgi:hypothetical protein
MLRIVVHKRGDDHHAVCARGTVVVTAIGRSEEEAVGKAFLDHARALGFNVIKTEDRQTILISQTTW